MVSKQADADLSEAVKELFANLVGPAMEMFNQLFKFQTWIPKFTERLNNAVKAEKGLTLTAEDTKNVAILLKVLSDILSDKR